MLVDSLAHIDGWVFDLDGTLTQPVLDFAHIRNHLNIPSGEDILGYINAQPAALQLTLHSELYALELGYARQAQPAYGAKQLLSFLHDAGKHLGILTRNDRDIALATLDAIGLRQFFNDVFILGRDEAPPKPSGDGVRFLCAQWQVTTDRSAMIGDHMHDLGAGRDAGVMTINVHPAPQASWQAATDLHVDSLTKLYIG